MVPLLVPVANLGFESFQNSRNVEMRVELFAASQNRTGLSQPAPLQRAKITSDQRKEKKTKTYAQETTVIVFVIRGRPV